MNLITGSEVISNLNDPMKSVVEFYRAFNSKDLDGIRNVWLKSDEVKLYNPIGGITNGWENVVKVYENIFTSGMDVQVHFFDYTIFKTSTMFCIAGREKGQFFKGNELVKIEIRTSRLFEYINDKWYQIHHHGSIDDPTMLKQYQVSIAKIFEKVE